MVNKGISILGSTGSIGCNTLRVIETLAEPRLRVVALAAGNNVERLAEQVKTHLPEVVSVENEKAAPNRGPSITTPNSAHVLRRCG